MGASAAGLPDPMVDSLARTYWRPMCAYLHAQWKLSPEKAEDLTQDFFLTLCRGLRLPKIDRLRGGLRTALLRSLDGLARSRGRHPAERPREQTFQREWVRLLVEDALERLQRECERDGRARPAPLAPPIRVRRRLLELVRQEVRKQMKVMRDLDSKAQSLLSC